MNPISKKISTHFMPGDGAGWALDEDQRQMREALQGMVNETSLARSEIIHTPFWQGLSSIAPKILENKFVIAHADNPPFFYLKQPDFLWGQQVVNLWIARSHEALEQFQALKLPVEYIPYCIDPKLFFHIDAKKELRKKFGVPEHAYVIANFHRDSEGSNLSLPKVQKAPELFLAVLKGLKKRGSCFHVLLAGPRRHWLRKALIEEGISFTFVGKQGIEEDDFRVNILKRLQLNELINAADLYFIPSRWEGGPQSVMEAAACRCKILSTPVGVAKDILERHSLFSSVDEAVSKIIEDQESDSLQKTLQPQWERWESRHTTKTLQEGLQRLYTKIPELLPQARKPMSAFQNYRHQTVHVLCRWLRKLGWQSKIHSVGWSHEIGKDSDLDNILLNASKVLRDKNIRQHLARGSGVEIVGWPSEKMRPAKKRVVRFQWVIPEMESKYFLPEALLLAPSVQDILNLRAAGCFQPAIVLPWPIASAKSFSQEPFVVGAGDFFASIDIWKAMNQGRPIIYPKKSAYYEQVFHAGLSFQSEEELPELIQKAREKVTEFRLLAKIPTLQEAEENFKKLLVMKMVNKK